MEQLIPTREYSINQIFTQTKLSKHILKTSKKGYTYTTFSKNYVIFVYHWKREFHMRYLNIKNANCLAEL